MTDPFLRRCLEVLNPASSTMTGDSRQRNGSQNGSQLALPIGSLEIVTVVPSLVTYRMTGRNSASRFQDLLPGQLRLTINRPWLCFPRKMLSLASDCCVELEIQRLTIKIELVLFWRLFHQPACCNAWKQARSNSDANAGIPGKHGERYQIQPFCLSINDRVANGPERCDCQMFPEATFSASSPAVLSRWVVEVFGMFPVGPVLR